MNLTEKHLLSVALMLVSLGFIGCVLLARVKHPLLPYLLIYTLKKNLIVCIWDLK